MSFLRNWFKRLAPEDYEEILASLADDIQKRQTRLSEIRLRERRTTLLFTLYALASWVAYVSLWYMGYIPDVHLVGGRQRWGREVTKAGKALPVFIGPIIILFIRRIVQIWYTRIGDAEEKTLKMLKKQQRNKIEEIKKKTNYNTTRNLIERYDDLPNGSPGTPQGLRKRNVAPGMPVIPGPPVTPQRLQQPPPVPGSAMSPALQNRLAVPPPPPMTPPRKQWYDKLADALLGDDEPTMNSPASKYALICEKCFAHNGLVKESIWEDTQYVCPKCGHFNVSMRSKRERSRSASPRSPASALSPSPPQQGAAFAPPLGAPAAVQAAQVRGVSEPRDEHLENEGNSSVMVVDS